MEHGTTLLAILHIAIAFLLVTVVLLQDSKGGGMGGAFGGGSSQTIFGATGAASFMVKVTRTLAIMFMITCMGLTLLLTHGRRSVIDNLSVSPSGAKSAPAQPGQPGQPPAAPSVPAPPSSK